MKNTLVFINMKKAKYPETLDMDIFLSRGYINKKLAQLFKDKSKYPEGLDDVIEWYTVEDHQGLNVMTKAIVERNKDEIKRYETRSEDIFGLAKLLVEYAKVAPRAPMCFGVYREEVSLI
jgi:hypothetical protein